MWNIRGLVGKEVKLVGEFGKAKVGILTLSNKEEPGYAVSRKETFANKEWSKTAKEKNGRSGIPDTQGSVTERTKVRSNISKTTKNITGDEK